MKRSKEPEDVMAGIRCKECSRVPWAHHHECSIGFREELKNKAVDKELISKGKNVINDFDESKKLVVHPKRKK